MTLEGFEGGDVVLLSYDVRGERRSVAARVCQIVFGRAGARRGAEGGTKREGFLWRPGVVWVGQSVLLLPPRDGEELRARLDGLGVRVSCARISVPKPAVEAFRRSKRAAC